MKTLPVEPKSESEKPSSRIPPTGTLSMAFFGEVEQLNSLPVAEPEFIEVEMTLDTGASVHVIN